MSNDFTKIKAPEVTFNKNGYEIRAGILDMARGFTMDDYNSKLCAWEYSIKKDQTTDEVVIKVAMPEFPGLAAVLKTAEQMYAFVSSTGSKK